MPVLARDAAELTVFQRTPGLHRARPQRPPRPRGGGCRSRTATPSCARPTGRWAPPSGPASPRTTARALAADEDERREVYERRWEAGGLPFLAAFNDLLIDPDANETAADFVRGKIHEVVDDPEVAERLSPRQVIGCKRMCVDTGYLATYNRPNVHLVDVSETPIEAVVAEGVRTTAGTTELDVLVFATGFDAMTGALARIAITGRDGRRLSDEWEAGPHTYLGLAMEGFPNLFTVTGTGQPVGAHQHGGLDRAPRGVDQPTLLAHARAEGVERIEADHDAQEELGRLRQHGRRHHPVPHLQLLVPGRQRPRQAPGVHAPARLPPYAEQCAHVAAQGYEGFTLT